MKKEQIKNKRYDSERLMKYYGVHACLAIWKKRADDIVRVYVDQSMVKTFSPVLKWCAEQKKVYHIIPSDELEKVSDSIHHEGVCIVANEPQPIVIKDWLTDLSKSRSPYCFLYLDGVQNPHNLGSIMRSCAHFGITDILGEQGKLPAMSPSACRIAKGAAEIVRLVPLSQPLQYLRSLQKMGFSFIATSSHQGDSLYRFTFPTRSIIAFGSESCGIARELMSVAKSHLQIPGSGFVESLNVSVAASLCLGEYYRQHSS
jgi:RNA methyltransferase, TrmH family